MQSYMLTLRLQMDNAAFEEDRAAEAARILRRLAASIERGAGDPDHCAAFNNAAPTAGWLFDANGNSAGTWEAKQRRIRN